MKDSDNYQKLYIRARAKIYWGESAEHVQEMLIKEGMDNDNVNRTIKDLLSEREGEIKDKGKNDLLVGAGIFSVSMVLIAIIFHIGLIPLKGIAFVGLFSLYGSYKLIKGQNYFFNAKSIKGSLQDL